MPCSTDRQPLTAALISIPPFARNLLTPRQLEIMLLLPAGDAEIARKLSLSSSSVKTHTRRIRQKFEIPSRHILVELAPQILASDAPLPVAIICPNCGNLIDITNPQA